MKLKFQNNHVKLIIFFQISGMYLNINREELVSSGLDTPSTSGIESSEFQWNFNSAHSYSFDEYSSPDFETQMMNPNIAITVTPTDSTLPSIPLNNSTSQSCQEGEEFQELIQQLIHNENFNSIISQNGLDKYSDEVYEQLTNNIGQIDLSDNGKSQFK